MSDPVSIQKKLPLWRSVKEAYLLTWENLTKLSGPLFFWLIVTAVGVAAIEWALWLPPLENSNIGNLSFVKLWATTVITLVTGAVVAVSWHQLLLQNRLLTLTNTKFDDRVWRYFFWGVVGLLPSIIAFELFQHWASGFTAETTGVDTALPSDSDDLGLDDGNEWGCMACILGLTVFSVPIFAILGFIQLRFSMMLPAVALNAEAVGPRQAWLASSGNFWRLFWGTYATFAPFVAIGLVPVMLLEDESRPLNYAIISSAYYSFLFLGGMVSVAFLSVAFRHFFPDEVRARISET